MAEDGMAGDGMAGDGPREFSATEEVATTPGWVESELDELLRPLPDRPSIRRLRTAYLDGLAASDTEQARSRYRQDFLRGLEADGIGDTQREALDGRLLALEAEIATRT